MSAVDTFLGPDHRQIGVFIAAQIPLIDLGQQIVPGVVTLANDWCDSKCC